MISNHQFSKHEKEGSFIVGSIIEAKMQSWGDGIPIINQIVSSREEAAMVKGPSDCCCSSVVRLNNLDHV